MSRDILLIRKLTLKSDNFSSKRISLYSINLTVLPPLAWLMRLRRPDKTASSSSLELKKMSSDQGSTSRHQHNPSTPLLPGSGDTSIRSMFADSLASDFAGRRPLTPLDTIVPEETWWKSLCSSFCVAFVTCDLIDYISYETEVIFGGSTFRLITAGWVIVLRF